MTKGMTPDEILAILPDIYPTKGFERIRRQQIRAAPDQRAAAEFHGVLTKHWGRKPKDCSRTGQS